VGRQGVEGLFFWGLTWVTESVGEETHPRKQQNLIVLPVSLDLLVIIGIRRVPTIRAFPVCGIVYGLDVQT